MEKEKLYLIDATALLYRAYYAFIRNPLINSKGINTNAIFGTINSFLGFIQKFNPRFVIVSFDCKEPTFRHELSDMYKANRPPMPDELILQIEPVKQFFYLIGLPEISIPGYEADDVLATLTMKYKDNYEIILVTGDKDYSQLVNDGISIYDPMKDKLIDRKSVIEKYSIAPEQFVDYLAIVGDSSDNIPGVKGIGEVGASKLLQEFGSLDGIYENLNKIPEKLRMKLILDKDNAYLSRELAQMHINVPLPELNLDLYQFVGKNLLNALTILDEYEIPSLKKRILSYLPDINPETLTLSNNQGQKASMNQIDYPQKPKIETNLSTISSVFSIEELNYVQEDFLKQELQSDNGSQNKLVINCPPATFKAILIDTEEKLTQLISDLSHIDVISLDTETTGTDALTAVLVGLSLCFSCDKAYYLPFAHCMSENLNIKKVLPIINNALMQKTIIGHNLKYDLTILQQNGLRLDNNLFDTMLAAYVLDPGTNQYSLDECALRELNYVMQPISELIGSGKKQISFDLVDVQKACFYSAEDAWATFRLYNIYQKKLTNTGLSKLYYQIELPLVRVLMNMELNGVHIDTSVLGELSRLINTQLKILIDKIYAIAGYQFNINSTQQLAKLLFEEMKLPIKKKTKTGTSTDISVLEELAEDYEIAALLMEYRQLTKLENTYVNALPKMINPITGRVHSSFNQTITSTGRLSSSNPNLQNIPIRTEIGKQIRKAFCAADDDKVILAADYSQIELRLLALMSKDRYLLEGFANGIDIHRQTAAYIFHKNVEEVTPEERRQAKVINFGLLYGMGYLKLSKELGISPTLAKDIIKHYFEQFTSVQEFILHCHQKAKQKGYAETLLGRRLYLPYINSSNKRLQSESERVALNMPIQGTAADLIKIAMLNVYERIKHDQDIKMILQVHDELVFEVKKNKVELYSKMVKETMAEALPKEYRSMITLEVDTGWGSSWFEAHA